MTALLDRWNQEYFEGKLSAPVLEFLKDVPNQSEEVRSFVERMFRFMKRAKFPAQDFSLVLGWAIGFMPSRILPGAWGGIIPPITIEGRHQKIDDYLAENPWNPLRAGSTLLDLGCGFPPRTTLDTTTRFPDWRITGADPSFGKYMVYDDAGNYACFREDRTIRYFQPGKMDFVQWDRLYKDPEATRARFASLLEDLLAGKKETTTEELLTIEQTNGKVVCNPLRMYERPNLSFIEGGIGEVSVRDLEAVRCFNVLMYFDSHYRKEAFSWISEILKPGGLFICGVNWARSVASRYSVYRKESDRLVLKEFAFSIDNVRAMGVVNYFALHDDDFETNQLAHAVGLMRSDSSFLRDFDQKLDELAAETQICPRGPDGYLGGVDQGITPAELERRVTLIEAELNQKGFADRAVDVLKRSGYQAWRNCVGHVAFVP